MLGGFLLLPSGLEVDWPMLPPLDKMGVTAIATVLLCWMMSTPVPRPPRSGLIFICAAAFVLSPIFTSLGNSYELRSGGGSIPGFYPADGLKFAGRNLLMLIPFYIGSRFLATDNARALLLKAIPTAMIFYSLPMLIEIRLSPQIHRWVYGYFPHESFGQQVRDGGFRPVVFFSHGLGLALFTCLALLAAIVWIRLKGRILQQPAAVAAAYFSALLVLCKSFGPMMYAVVFAPMIIFTRPRLWVMVGCVVSLLVCAYPLLRKHDLTPVQLVSSIAEAVSPARSLSFQTRVDNEGQLLAKANEKPLIGWGGWGRNRIIDEATGKDVSITDGAWIIQFGTFGWLGYLSLFGLLAVAQFRALSALGKAITSPNVIRGGVSLLLTVYIIDSIPNATQLSLIFLLAGSIASVASVSRRQRIKELPTPEVVAGAAALARQ